RAPGYGRLKRRSSGKRKERVEMARGIGNRQKKTVTAKKVWIRQPATPKGPKREPRPKKKTGD
ncbi:MAG TPA: hypothetical protein VGK70_13865, partial [Thermoanaerobaculia bacterium]